MTSSGKGRNHTKDRRKITGPSCQPATRREMLHRSSILDHNYHGRRSLRERERDRHSKYIYLIVASVLLYAPNPDRPVECCAASEQEEASGCKQL